MKKYLFKRLIQLPIILFGVVVAVFLIIQITPGDPAAVLAGPSAGPAEVEALREQLGLNKPVLEQFFGYLVKILHGDFGTSYIQKTPIGREIIQAFGHTVYLIVFARVWSILAAVPLGIFAALRQNKVADKISMGATLIGVSLPQFWVGLMLMMIFSLKLGWLPFSGMGEGLFTLDSLTHIILPAFILGLPQVASIARLTRSEMLEVLRQDYIKTARAKGLAKRVVIYKHALKNASLPLITVIGIQTGYMLGGSVVVENIFAWPGLGRYSINAIMGSDFPAIQASVLLFAVLFLTVNIIVDLTYSLVDPRIKY